MSDFLRTTGAARRFTSDPVGPDVVAAVLDDARFAPSGGNRQPWRVAVVEDRTVRRQMASLMQGVWNDYRSRTTSGAPFNVIDDDSLATEPAPPVANELLDAIDTVPVVLAVAADLRLLATMDGHLGRLPLTGGASIYPFCWNLLLAARSRGLGGVITTFLSRAEATAGPLLGLPAHHALAATIFLGVPEHQNTKLRRRPVAEFATLDRFDGPPYPATPD
jgi:nitroreductase